MLKCSSMQTTATGSGNPSTGDDGEAFGNGRTKCDSSIANSVIEKRWGLTTTIGLVFEYE